MMLRALSLLVVLIAGPAAAQTVAFGGMRADTRAPVEIAADTLRVDQSTGQATITGNVVIGQGDMRLSAETVTITYAPGNRQKIKSLHATGKVTLVSGPDAAEAKDAVYDVEAGTVTLTGDVVLVQGDNVLSGEKVDVDLASGSANVAGRVRTVLQPGGN